LLQTASADKERKLERFPNIRTVRPTTADVQIETVASDFEALPLGDLMLEALDLVVFKLKDLAAIETDHMVMMVSRGALVALNTVAELTYFNEVYINQQAQGSIHGRKTDAAVPITHFAMQVFSAEVIPAAQNHAKNGLALFREPQTAVKQLVLKSD
jgi:hypothetical protein